MSDKILYAVERFPDLVQAIKQYASDNRFFHSLCEDYGEAVEMLHHLEGLNDFQACTRLSVCRALVADLEEEILSELQLWNDGERGADDRIKP